MHVYATVVMTEIGMFVFISNTHFSTSPSEKLVCIAYVPKQQTPLIFEICNETMLAIQTKDCCLSSGNSNDIREK